MREWRDGLMACEKMIKSSENISDGWKSAYDYYICELSERGVYGQHSPSVEYLNGWMDCVEHYRNLSDGVEK